MKFAAVLLLLLASKALGDANTTGPNGIDSKATGLDGDGIIIGQIEPGRSGKPGRIPPEPSISNTNPEQVYFRTQIAGAGEADDIEHATFVAEAMIADKSIAGLEGVAPKAKLHSSAVGHGSADVLPADVDDDWAITANRIARIGIDTPDKMRAINASAIRPIQEQFESLNGNTLITKFVDWSARVQDVLYVVGWGNNDSPEKRAPTDNFNGMTVAASQVDPANGNTKFNKWASVNAVGGQPDLPRNSSISLIAPGQDIGLLMLMNGVEVPTSGSGTSLAAPHVTATAALLQQYFAKQLALPNHPGFAEGSRRHEVMKAVMMNAADKLNGVHGSTRDIINRDGVNWLHSVAYTTPELPLDPWIGTGHLNAKRSLQQLIPGEHDPGNVPLIGWDYQSVGDRNEYVFDQQIGGGNTDYIAATLTWDRRVEKTPSNNNYLTGQPLDDKDIPHSLNNLDLYLMPANSNDLSQAKVSSISPAMSVEHIFFKIPQNGSYKLVVVNNPMGGIGDSQNYALAWWFGTAPPLSKPGDYNNDGNVDAADYVLWRKSPSNYGGNPGGYDTWRANYGAPSGSGSGLASIPEPSATCMTLVGMLCCVAVRTKKSRPKAGSITILVCQMSSIAKLTVKPPTRQLV